MTLEPGQHQNVEITLSQADLADLHLLQYFDAGSKKWVTAPGHYGIQVGGSSDTTLRDSFGIH